MMAKLACAFMVGLWVLPAIRLGRFLKWAWNYYTETASINAANDWHYATCLGAAYFVGLVSSLLLCWLLGRRQTAVLWVLWLFTIACLIRVLCVAPEEPIVLFPFFSPMRFGLVLAAMGAVGVASYFDGRPRLQHELPDQRFP